MFRHKPHRAIQRRELTRRTFLRSLGVLAVGAVAVNAWVRRALATAGDWYQRVMMLRDFSGPAVTVYKMVPLAGRRYSRADLGHMANKIFPTAEAALARRQHALFFYGLKAVELPRSAVNGFDKWILFLKRKDFDARGHTDRRHWTRLGISVDTAFQFVRDA
jgi:hypothetical protein